MTPTPTGFQGIPRSFPRELHALCPQTLLGLSLESLSHGLLGRPLLSPHGPWCLVRADSQALLLSQLPSPPPPPPSQLPLPFSPNPRTSVPSTSEAKSHQLTPILPPELTYENALGLLTGCRHNQRLAATPGGWQDRDSHPHCEDVETKAQAGKGRHSGSKAPSTRLVLPCDMKGKGHQRPQLPPESPPSAPHSVQPNHSLQSQIPLPP